jgi:hypothetical protein
MRKKIEWEWELLDEFTKRAKVIGGWVIEYGCHTNKGSITNTMVFVPDRDHEWAIAPKIVEKAAIKTALAKDFDVSKSQT